MKRNTEVSRSPATSAQEAAGTGGRSSACPAALAQASALLAHSMQQSDTPICELGNALARMARTLSDMGTPLFGADGGRPVADTTSPHALPELQVFRNALARDLAVCIQSLQFHDRLMQQLAQARDILSGVGANRLLARVADAPANKGSIELF